MVQLGKQLRPLFQLNNIAYAKKSFRYETASSEKSFPVISLQFVTKGLIDDATAQNKYLEYGKKFGGLQFHK